ncbi:hypothetical protein ACE41H_21285 [Paenibacillus enshidis]|uniref:Uncharacterized protein n=1 Tax=Paenibacillus enshidis TaxID=1458439 RepID=A0ABV5AYK5_9BACL
MTKMRVYPTCLICDKLDSTMTSCAIYGLLSPGQINDTSIGKSCSEQGDYIRRLHATPNEFNYQTGAKEEESLLVFNIEDEAQKFRTEHGITIEEWIQQTFSQQQSNKE